MKRTWKKLFAFVCAFTLVAAPVTYNTVNADAPDSNSNGVQNGNASISNNSTTSSNNASVGTDYTLTIPATLNVANAGWNATDGITAKVKSGDTFDTSKKLTVTAASTNSWALKSGENSVGYNLATSSADYSASAAPASWEFSAEELNAASGTNKAMGIIVDDYSTKPAGDYSDTVTFTAKVESAETIVDLSTLTADYVAKDGETLTGTLAANVKISIADGATVTLKDADITNLGIGCDWAGINCPNDATIILKGTNTICAGRGSDGYNNYPGIWIASGKTLTIDGDGSLTAYSNDTNPSGAGIGGGYSVNCGNIVINGGTITATGGEIAAGIGSGDSSCGNITINGGTITATGGRYAAGIGSGSGVYSNASCGNITINGGTVNATGGNGAAGIGSGRDTSTKVNTSCGDITIANTVTKVTATKGNGDTGAHSIGAGGGSTCGTVTIGGNVGAISESPYTYEP